MNDLVQPFITRPGTINSFMITRDGHRYETFVQGNYALSNNISDMTTEERRFETKVDILKDLAKFKTKKSDNFIYNIKESYVFPEDKLDNIYDKWEDRKFFPEGYKPELEGAVTNDKGNVVYDERGKIKKEPTLLEKVIPKIRNMVFPGSPQTKAPTPPLPGTPMPDKKLVASMPQINQQTGLTRTESALLSPSEQVIARRT